MSETINTDAARARRLPEFPHRLTVCIASDQLDTLQQARKIYRATESFMMRLAWDQFCRANQIAPSINGGSNNGK